MVSTAINTIPTLVVDLAMLAGCAIYLAWISWAAALILVVLVILLTLIYRLLLMKAWVAIRLMRESRDTLFQHFRSLVEGIKEIKLHNGRKDAFFGEELNGTTQYLRRQNIITMNRYAIAEGWCQSMYYILLGVVIFGFPALYYVSLKTLTAYVFVALYMMGPILGIVGSIPYFLRGKASLEKLEEIGVALADINKVSAVADSRAEGELINKITSFRTPPLVELRNEVFRHGQEKNGNAFTLGPIRFDAASRGACIHNRRQRRGAENRRSRNS